MIVRLNFLLALVLVLSCIWLIRTSHESRRLFVELDKAQVQSHELQLDYERLQLDKRAQATPLRVEKLAREKLRMFNSNPTVTHYVSTASGVPAPAVSAPGASAATRPGGQP